MHFRYFCPTKVYVGQGVVRENAAEFAKLGKRCLIVTGKNSARRCGALADAVAALESVGIAHELFDGIMQNPYLSTCVEAAKQAKAFGADFVLGIGGGSPLDAAKAIAVLAANDIAPMDAFAPEKWQHHPLPIALIGTTSGTGSEVTQYAVMTLDDSGRKRSIASELCFAKVAFGDPRYTASLDAHFTRSTGLDALSHSIESYFNKTSNALSQPFALEGIRLCYHNLKDIAGKSPEEITLEQREALYIASIHAGIAIAQTGTAYCHSLGYFLTEEHHISHGLACTALLPSYLDEACAHMADKLPAMEQYVGASVAELRAFLSAVVAETELPVLTPAQAGEIADRMAGTANLLKSPGSVDREKAVEILLDCFGA